MIVRPNKSQSVWTLLFALKGSIVPVIWPQVLYTMLLSLAVVVAEYRGIIVFKFTLSAAYLTLLGLTLAIFLGFRNTVAYQRWWEARTLWGELVISTRNLARQTLAYMPGLPEAKRRELFNGMIAFTHAMRHQLRDSNGDADLERWLPTQARATIAASPNRANAVLNMLGEAYARNARESGVDSMLLASMSQELDRFSAVLGGCERIRNTPIPFAYILLLHRTVHLYCFILPFCLISSLGWLTPIAVGILAYTFFGLDAIGTEIEDPFDVAPNDLPLDALSCTIEINLLSTLGDTDLPPLPQPQDWVLY